MILWSDKTFTCVTFNEDPEPVRNVESIVPFGNKRTTLFTVLLLYFVKLPTIIILPSCCKAISYTIPVAAPIVVSKVAS
ncbi:hypothetical protein D3C87_1919080 [compost metagenome]